MEKKTVVLVPYGKSREHLHGDCIDVVRHGLGITVLEVRGGSQIDMIRSQLACAALAHGADVALFIDSDILFDPLDVSVLANVARETQGVVGAPYSERRMGAGLVGCFEPTVDEVTFGAGGCLYPAPGALGMGFTAIHRSVFERLDALPQYAPCNSQGGIIRPYFQRIIANGYWLYEDASFCHAAREAGAGTFTDTRVIVKHLGDHAFSVEDVCRQTVDAKSFKVRVRARQ